MPTTGEHDERRRMVRRFIDGAINPHVDAWEAAGIIPVRELLARLGTLAPLGLSKPERDGGQGLDYSCAGLSGHAAEGVRQRAHET